MLTDLVYYKIIKPFILVLVDKNPIINHDFSVTPSLFTWMGQNFGPPKRDLKSDVHQLGSCLVHIKKNNIVSVFYNYLKISIF